MAAFLMHFAWKISDSILIDEARYALIIQGQAEDKFWALS